MRHLTVLATVLTATAVAAVPSALAATAPPLAVKVAVTAAQARFHTMHIHADSGLLSRRDPRWALVDGAATARNRLWAAWLHNDGASRWTLRYFDTTAPFQPASTAHGRVPCDLYPAFSEPACPSGPSAAQIRSRVAGQLTPTGACARIGAVLADGGYTFSFKPPMGGTLIVSWYTAPRGNDVKPKLLARGHADFLDSHPGRMKIVLTSTGRNTLAKSASLKMTAEATFTPIERAAVTASRTLTLTR
ncbi:MAG: hypothetical protein ACXVH3_31120 [Solirubrobacteraceae bacterium]